MKYRLLQRRLLGASLVLAALLALAGCAAATGPAAGGPVVDPGTTASVDVPAAKAADDLVDTGVYKGVYSYQDATDTLVHGSLVFSVTSGATLQKAVSTDRSVWVFEKTQDTTIKYTGSVTTGASGFTATFKPKTDTVIVLTVPFSPTLGNPPTLSYKKGGVALPTTVLKETSTAKVLTFNGSYSGGGGTAPANWKVSGSWDLLIQGTVVTGNYHGAVKAGTQSLPDTGSVSGTLSGTKITLSGTGPMGNGSGTITTSGISGTWTSSGTNPGSGTWSGSATFNAPVTPTLAGTAVTGVSVSSSTLTLTAGGTSSTLTATVVPAGASNPDVFWSSSNPAVAMVSSTGVVTPLVAGTATITATTADGAKTATTTVTVGSGTTPVTPVAVTGVSVTPSTLTLTAGGATGTLTAAVAPTNAANPAVTWSSSNTAIATVSSTGVVTPVAAGTTTITATTSDGAKTASATVTVEAGSTPLTPVVPVLSYAVKYNANGATGGSVPSDPLFYEAGKTFKVLDNTGTLVRTGYVFSGWNTKSDGLGSTRTIGSSYTMGTADVVLYAKWVKEVTVTSIYLNQSKLSLAYEVVRRIQLTATVYPSNAVNKQLTWASSNTDAVMVDQTGLITTHGLGTATITATSADGLVSASCVVNMLTIDGTWLSPGGTKVVFFGMSAKYTSVPSDSLAAGYAAYIRVPFNTLPWATVTWKSTTLISEMLTYTGKSSWYHYTTSGGVKTVDRTFQGDIIITLSADGQSFTADTWATDPVSGLTGSSYATWTRQ